MAESESPAGNQAKIQASLTWQDAAGAKKSLLLHAGDTVEIGRSPEAGISLATANVSRRHAAITSREDRFEVADLNSTNGTWVNGQRINASTQLNDGDVISVGFMDIRFTSAAREPAPLETVKDETFVVPLKATQPRLIISAGLQEGREIALVGREMTIGRATTKGEPFEIALQDRSVSRPHARLERVGDEFVLSDLESANGTLVNGKAILAPSVLADGDVLLIGETTLLFRKS